MPEPSRIQPPTGEDSPESLVRALRIVWFGLLMGQIMFAFVILLIGGPLWKGPGPSPLEMPLSLMLVLLAASAVFGQVALRRAFIAEVQGQAEKLRQLSDPLPQVAPRYRGFFIATHGLVEGTSLCALVSYMVTATPLPLFVVAASVTWFLIGFPGEDRVRRLVQNAIETA